MAIAIVDALEVVYVDECKHEPPIASESACDLMRESEAPHLTAVRAGQIVEMC